MLYVRGQTEDYDDWAKLGARGWNWSGVLPYFQRMEEHFSGNNDLHGTADPFIFPESDQVTPWLMHSSSQQNVMALFQSTTITAASGGR